MKGCLLKICAIYNYVLICHSCSICESLGCDSTKRFLSFHFCKHEMMPQIMEVNQIFIIIMLKYCSVMLQQNDYEANIKVIFEMSCNFIWPLTVY
jgi:hypothetical protein